MWAKPRSKEKTLMTKAAKLEQVYNDLTSLKEHIEALDWFAESDLDEIKVALDALTNKIADGAIDQIAKDADNKA